MISRLVSLENLKKNPFAVIFILSLSLFFLSISYGWYESLLTLHAFRQTQTALSVKYMIKGGGWFAYETPVFGPPWSIPFEFPLYQWIVALVAMTNLIEIDQAGRLVSILFFLSTLYPLFKILEAVGSSINQRFIVLTLYCISPEYIYWTRSFMIESTALALSIYYLWFVITYIHSSGRKREIYLILGITITGLLAGMVKITTFFAFGATGFFIWLYNLVTNKKVFNISEYRFLLFALIVPLIAVSLWTSYSDHLKGLNPIGVGVTSSALKGWNFGTMAQKISLNTWNRFYLRRIPDLIGSSWLLPLSLSISVLCNSRTRVLVWLAFLIFLLPLLTFTNLHYVHNYYVYANGIFLIISIGLICGGLLDSSLPLKRFVGLVLFCIIAFSSFSHYLNGYRLYQGKGIDLSKIAFDFKKFTGEDDVIIIIGHDWSPEVPYYVDRRAVMIPNWLSLDPGEAYFQEVKKNLKDGGYKVGGVVFGHSRNDINIKVINTMLREFEMQGNSILREYPNMTVFYRKQP